MFGWNIGFDKPSFLWLLLLLPLLWVFSFRTLAGLGPVRRAAALGLRSSVVILFVFALAEVQLLRTSNKMSVVYVLDQSESIPMEKRLAMRDYVISEVAEHRNRDREDLAGVIVFGAIAKVDNPPVDDDIMAIGESVLERTDATNLAEALKLAQALFTDDAARRIVVVSDGNENIGDAQMVAHSLVQSGIGIDCVPVSLPPRPDVAVEKVTVPADVREGQKFEARVVLSNFAKPAPDDAGVVSGTLELWERSSQGDRRIGTTDVDLDPGKNVFSFTHEINRNAMFTYKAIFTPNDIAQDRTDKNNQATAYTHVRGRGHVLLIEDVESPGEFSTLIERLEKQKLRVTKTDNANLFDDPADLLEYDTIVLANVPRSSGDPAAGIVHFSDDQIEQLVRNTEQMGCGLVMIGGPNSFGAGGWTNTDLEKAMPVDFQIKNTKVRAVGALVLLMHASEMAEGNHWQKVVAKEAIKALGPADYCGLIHWGFRGDQWLWTKSGRGVIRVEGMRNTMLARIDNMAPGDMPEFDPAMRMAFDGLRTVPAAVKHMIIISDGDPSRPHPKTVERYRDEGIKISTVAIGAHGVVGHRTLETIATRTGGKYYEVTDPRALPKIYQREARRVAKPLIFNPDDGSVQPQVTGWNPIIDGIDADAFQPLRAYVATTIKENPLVEQLIIADQPDDGGKNSTLLASWNYGLGRTVAFTSDAGHLWADRWASANYYDKFFSQLIRYSMRPIDKEGEFTVATKVKDGRVHVVVTALDTQGDFLNSLDISGHVLGPDNQPLTVQLQQDGPGRYIGTFDGSQPGSYLINVVPGPGYQAFKTGVNVPYSAEFRDRQANWKLLENLSSLTPEGGAAGKMITGKLTQAGIGELLQINTFRHDLAKAKSIQDAWPLVILIAACVFFADVFVRRVAIELRWVVPAGIWLQSKLLRRQQETVEDDRIERLRSRKAAIHQQLEERRASARFERDAETAPEQHLADVLDELAAPRQQPAPQRPASDSLAPDQVDEEQSYTSRLLEAKKKALRKKD